MVLLEILGEAKRGGSGKGGARLAHHRELCTLCGGCTPLCPEDALTVHETFLEIDGRKCTTCGACAPGCPTGALKMEGAGHGAQGASHRSHCSVVGFTEVLPSIAGLLMDKEITALDKGLKGHEHPTVFSLGGTKADDSIKVTKNVLGRGGADKILTSGVVATVFMMAAGIDVGEANRKFVEDQEYLNQIPIAAKLLKDYPGKIALPVDVALNKNGERVEVAVDKLPTDLPIADIGLETIVRYSKELKDAKVTVLNGPTGIFEQEKFKLGTAELLKAATESGYSIAGGGHSVAAIDQLGLESKFSHVSMGGGASITYLSGEPLPGIEALKMAAARARKA